LRGNTQQKGIRGWCPGAGRGTANLGFDDERHDWCGVQRAGEGGEAKRN